MASAIRGVILSSTLVPVCPLRSIAPGSRIGISPTLRSSNLSSCAFTHANDVYPRIAGQLGSGSRGPSDNAQQLPATPQRAVGSPANVSIIARLSKGWEGLEGR